MVGNQAVDEDLFTFVWDSANQEGQLQIGPSDNKKKVGLYQLKIIETALKETGLKTESFLNVQVYNGRCDPDFEFPSTRNIKDDYEYEIGKDSPI